MSNAVIDFNFYKEYYPDLQIKDDKDAEEHWIDNARTGYFFPNPFVALETLQLDARLPSNFDISAYLQLNPDVKAAIRWDFQAIQHYIDYGVRENRQYTFILPTTNGSDAIINGDISSNNLERNSVHSTSRHTDLKTLRELENLPRDFNLASYLSINKDVRDSFADPVDGLRHYLKDGLLEKRSFLANRYNTKFIFENYGINVPHHLDVRDLPEYLRKALEVDFDKIIFLNEQELLTYHGITAPNILMQFDYEYYSLMLKVENSNLGNRAKCLEHFCKFGQYQAIDVAYELIFDVDFYVAEYGKLGRGHPINSDKPTDLTHAVVTDRTVLFQSWLRSDAQQPRWPNLLSWANATYGFTIPKSIIKQAKKLTMVMLELRDVVRPTKIYRYLIEDKSKNSCCLKIVDSEAAEFVTHIADRFSSLEEFAKADFAYSLVLRDFPSFGLALRHRADQVQRRGSFGLAASLREYIIEAGVANEWTYLTLAECYSNLGESTHAAKALRRGVEAFPADIGLRLKSRQLSDLAFDECWSHAPAVLLSEGTQVAHAEIQDALALCTPNSSRPSIGRNIRTVAIYGNHDLAQCRFYRIDQKLEQLEAAGFNVTVFNYSSQTSNYLAQLTTFDLVIVYRVPAFPFVIRALQKTSALGIPTVYDIDDLIFDAAHFPPDLSSYAGQIDAYTHASIACGTPLFSHAMSLCDYGIASTRALQPFMADRVRTGQVFTQPNALGALHMRQTRTPRPDADRVTTIFYGSGTKAHKQDFRDFIEPALVQILDKHGAAVRVVILGYIELSENLSRFSEQISIRTPLSNIEDYWEILSSADINLSVLSQSVFNDCKSEIKWLEAAMMGIPSVVSRTATYEDVIEDGRTGLLCSDWSDFANALDLLISQPAERTRIGSLAREAALKRYSQDAQVSNIQGMVNAIQAQRPRPSKRLLIVNVFYPPQAIGGATRVVHDNVRNLVETLGPEWEINVVCTLEGGATPYELDWYVRDGVRVFCITAADCLDIDKNVEDSEMSAPFQRCLDIIKPDIVHFHCIQRLTTTIVDAVRKRDIPFLVTLHDGWWISPNQFLLGSDDRVELYDFRDIVSPGPGKLPLDERGLVLRRHLRAATRILTVSEAFADVCRAAGVTNIAVNENGVSRLPNVIRTRSISGRVRLGHIGGMARHKGFSLLRNILMTHAFKNLSLIVVNLALADGVRQSEMWGTTPVEIRGKVPQAKVGQIYGDIDILVAPSLWPESYGLVSREAIASGCWVIGSDRGAIADCVVEGVNGFVVDVSSPRGLIEVLERIDGDPETYLQPPSIKPTLRTALEQAEELALIYDTVLVEETRPRA